MTERTRDLVAFMAAMEPVLGLTIEETWRLQVVEFLKMAEGAAALFMDLPLDDSRDEAAAVFRPGGTS